MLKQSEYLQHAEECRKLARGMPPGEHRDQLVRIAETWDRLAADRVAKIAREANGLTGDAPAGRHGAGFLESQAEPRLAEGCDAAQRHGEVGQEGRP